MALANQTRQAVSPRPNRTAAGAIWTAIVRALYGSSRIWATDHDVVSARLPKAVGTEILNVCNANCSFCGYGKGVDGKLADPRRKSKLSPEVFQHTLKLFSEAGGGVFYLTPILGEVSADKRWLELVAAARAYPNVDGVSCFTNAILLDRFGAENILTSGLTELNISSAFGSAEQYRRLYGVDQYDRVIRNVLDILETNRRLGFPVEVTVQLRIDKPFDAFFESDLYSQIEGLIQSKDKIAILDDDWDDFRGIIGLDGLPDGHKFKKHIPDKSVPCYALYRKLEVLQDGTIQACACRVEPELWAGNIMDHNSLEEAWRNPKLEALRTDWHNGTLPECCNTCSHYQPFTDLVRPYRPRTVASHVTRKIAKTISELRKN
jgi:radical SAM protein with 4Fe4S-binding SPASM domain